MQLEFKKQLARCLAGVGPETAAEVSRDLAEYMARVFRTDKPS
jgi:hypothetical protein